MAKGAGRGKSQRKKRDYAFHVRSQVLAGLINTPEGNWINANSSSVSTKAYGFSYAGVAGHALR